MMKVLQVLLPFLLLASASAKAGGKVKELDPADYAAEGGKCDLTWHSVQEYYKPLSGNNAASKKLTCYPGALTDDNGIEYYLACDAFKDDNGQSGTVIYSGTCKRRDCNGLDDSDEIEGPIPGENEATERITICHRTCSSEVNPWVRITIDLDAWEKPAERCGSAANGHQPHIDPTNSADIQGHVICDDIKPRNHWGSDPFLESIMIESGDQQLFGDYEIMRHGTRENVREKIASGEIQGYIDEKDYWRYWERACPYVRNGLCCGKHGEGCCGFLPEEWPPEEEPEDEPVTGSPTKKPTKSPTDSPTPGPTPQPSVGATPPPTAYCPDEPENVFVKNMYITFMGSEHHNHDNLISLLAEAVTDSSSGYTVDDLQTAILDEYNKLSANGICETHGKKFTSVTLDQTDSTHAVNKDYQLVGIRMKAVVEGVCTNCADQTLFSSDLCDVLPPDSYCPDCVARDGTVPASIVSVSGNALATAINERFGWTGTGAEIFRIQGDIDGETTCNGGYKYILADGNIKCIG